MSFSSCLVFFAIIVAVTYASTAYPSSTTTTTTGSPTSTPTSPPSYYCAPCIRKPTTLPVLSYIQGDNYCKPGQTDQEILVQLYNALGGSSWTNKKNWLSGDYCQWYGVVCDHNKKIVTINLANNNLKGNQLPPSIGCLTNLQSLVLDNNTISGQLPQNLCNLKTIQYLTMPNNNLGGSIPTCFGNLNFLLHLYLFGNGLVGELPDFSNFTNVKEIHLENNCLSGQVPQDIPSTQIIDLSFANNDFSGCIPDFYSNIDVDFSGNSHFCSQDYIPCFLTAAKLGCASRPRVNVQGPFKYCPNLCLSISQ